MIIAGCRLLDAVVRKFSEIILVFGKSHIPAGFVQKLVSLYSKEVKLLVQ